MRFYLFAPMLFGATMLPAGSAAEPGPPVKKGGLPGPAIQRGGPAVGEPAPDFELKLLDSKETFRLSGNFGKRPTVLLFHSFT
jgi:hypothetical protein